MKILNFEIDKRTLIYNLTILAIAIPFIIYLKLTEDSIYKIVEKRYLDDYYQDIVEEKYKDQNQHLYETVITNSNRLFLEKERSGFYKTIEIGDSIYKEKNSLKTYVFRDDTLVKIHILEFKR